MTLQPPSTVFLPLSKVFKSLLKLLSPIWEPAWLSERIKPYIITCGFLESSYHVTFDHIGKFQQNLGNGEGSNVCLWQGQAA